DRWLAAIRSNRIVWRKLAIHHPFRDGAVRLDYPERHLPAEPRIRSISVHFTELDSVLFSGDPGADHHDEPKSQRGAGSFARGERLQSEFESGVGDPSLARKNRPSAAHAIQPPL